MSDLTPFELLMRASDVRLPGVWQAMFEESQAQLRASVPEGVDLLDVGRAAWDCLPVEAREEALDELVYGWWETYQDRLARNAFSEEAARG